MPMNEYGEIIRNSTTPPPIQSRNTNNSGNNNNRGGGSGSAIIVGIIILIAIIGFIIHATNNENSSNQNGNQDTVSSYDDNSNSDTDSYYNNDASSEYIIPFSDSEYISYSDLYGLSQTEVTLARNEIYARHGRKFTTDSIREYFESKSWYYPQYSPDDFSESVFNQYEKENLKTIVAYEQEKGWR